MKLSISEVLGVLASRGILPDSDEPLIDIPEDEIDFPEIGDLEEIINSNKIGAILSTNKDTIEEILTLLKDQDARKRCEDVARQIYSLDKGVSTYRDIYYKLTN